MEEYLNKTVGKEIKELKKTKEGWSLIICESICFLMILLNFLDHQKITGIGLNKTDKYLLIWPGWTIALFTYHIWITSMFSEKSLINKIHYFTIIIGSTAYHLTKNTGLI